MANGEFDGDRQDNPYAAPEAEASASPEGGAEDLPPRFRGGADVGEVFDAFGEMMADGANTGILWVVVVLQAITAAVSQVPNAVIQPQRAGQIGGSDFGILGVSYLFLFILGGVGVVLYRPLRASYFGGRDSIGSLGDAISDAMSRYGAVLAYMFVFALIVVVGTVLCIVPGLVASLGLAPGMYLVAASDQLSIGDALSGSWSVFKRHWASIILAGLAYVGVMLLVVGPLFFGLFAMGMGQSFVGRAFVSFVAGVPAIFFYTALFARVEVAERLTVRNRTPWDKISVPRR